MSGLIGPVFSREGRRPRKIPTEFIPRLKPPSKRVTEVLRRIKPAKAVAEKSAEVKPSAAPPVEATPVDRRNQWFWRGAWRSNRGHGPTDESGPPSRFGEMGGKRPRTRRPWHLCMPVPHLEIPGAWAIPLTRGKLAIIDAVDAPALHAYRKAWHATKEGYARSSTGGPLAPKTLLHHWLWRHWGMPDTKLLDHKNRNTLDYRRENIREATPAQNTWNTGHRKNNTSGFKGVCLDKHTGRWYAQLRIGGRRISLGNWDTAEEAAHAYNEAASERFGEFASLNKSV